MTMQDKTSYFLDLDLIAEYGRDFLELNSLPICCELPVIRNAFPAGFYMYIECQNCGTWNGWKHI